MRNRTLADLDRVVALGGGHGLGRVMSALSSLGSRLTGIVTTTGGAARVLAWLERWLQTEWPQLQVYLTSVTDHWATTAVAGPKSRALLQAVCSDVDFDDAAFPFMSWRPGTVAGVAARAQQSRHGRGFPSLAPAG